MSTRRPVPRISPVSGGARETPRRLALSRRISVPGVLCAAGFAAWIFQPVGNSTLVSVGYATVALGAVLNAVRRGAFIDTRVALQFLAVLLVGAVGVLHGEMLGNPGADSEFVFFVALPVVWLVIALGVDSRIMQAITSVIPWATLLIGILGVSFWLDARGAAMLPWADDFALGQGIGSTDYGSSLRFYPISSLVFVLPFLLVSLSSGRSDSPRATRAVSGLALVSATLLLFVSGRRAIMLSMVVGATVGFFMLKGGRLRSADGVRLMRSAVVILVIVVVAALLTGFSLGGMLQSVMDEVFSGSSVRAQSVSDLVDSWATSPVFGNGLGAVAPGPLRSLDRPWDYEVQYHLLLNAVGLTGLVVLGVVAVGLFVLAFDFARSNAAVRVTLAPLAAGAASMLVANATNPYLHTPGHYWMVLILVLGVNSVSRSRADRMGGRVRC